ncbi:MAG: exosortase C-terminal domain/associated protein EpsI [Myxococcota bacterium]
MIRALAAAAFLLLNLWIYARFASESVIPERATFAEFPLQLDAWSCREPQAMDEKTLRLLGATDYLICDFSEDGRGRSIQVYVGYHATQVREGTGRFNVNAIHPPEHCLPGAGWDIVDARVVDLDVAGLPAGHGLGAEGPEAKRFVIARGEARQLVYFWYQTQGRVIARNTDVLFYRFWGRATANRTDGSLVRLTVPIVDGDVAAAEAVVRSFADRFVPRLQGYIPL